MNEFWGPLSTNDFSTSHYSNLCLYRVLKICTTFARKCSIFSFIELSREAIYNFVKIKENLKTIFRLHLIMNNVKRFVWYLFSYKSKNILFCIINIFYMIPLLKAVIFTDVKWLVSFIVLITSDSLLDSVCKTKSVKFLTEHLQWSWAYAFQKNESIGVDNELF